MNVRIKVNLFALTGLLIFSACAPPEASVDTSLVQQTVAEDLTQVYQHGDEVGGAIKLEEILARALKYNLDTKVAELDELIAADDVTLQQLAALPSVTAKVQRVGRNNEGGSSSFSVLTGLESLQASISQEQYRNTHVLNMEWNLLDAGINLWRGKSATDKMMVAQERRRKVYHGVLQDTYAAFWRVAAAQQALPMINDLIGQTDVQLQRIEEQAKSGLVPLGTLHTSRAQLQDRRMQLTKMKHSLDLADIELKTLIDYPLEQDIVLDLEGRDMLRAGELPVIKGGIDNFEETAFMNRPEVREEILNKRMSMRDIKMSILETIPGVNLLFTYNYDSNEFLVYNRWIDGIVGLTASINKIITAPTRYNRAKNLDLLADKRRQALVAAVITQVHVARARYDVLSQEYADNKTLMRNADEVLTRATNFSDTGMMSKAELLNIKIDSSIAAINLAFAYSDAQDSYGRFINTLGIDLWDAGDIGLSVPEFAGQIKRNLADQNIFLISSVEPSQAPEVYGPEVQTP